MLETVPRHSQEFSARTAPGLRASTVKPDRWQVLAESAILVLGYPRSGTTWLAKIFDSHPCVMYRHEPDELMPPAPGLQPAQQIREWLLQRGLRVAAKRPHFRKSWRPAPLAEGWQMIATTLALAQLVSVFPPSVKRMGIPDLVVPTRWDSVRAAIKLVNWDGSAAAQTMPDARCVFILRHPCGQIASVMAGLATRQFGGQSDATDEAVDLQAGAALAQREGIDAAGFAKLPDAARHAWNWRAFNEPAVEGLRGLPNARVVVYEDLCRRPEAVSRELYSFAGLDWHEQTAAFLGTSTRQTNASGGYFDVFRSSGVVADRWRQTMSAADQDAVRTVLSTSSLARCWPDLASAG